MKHVKKICCLLAVVGMILVGCGTSDKEIEKLIQENAQLKRQMESPGTAENTAPPLTTSEPTVIPTEEAPLPEPPVKPTKKERYQQYAKKIKVVVTDKKVLPENWDIERYEDFIEIDYKVVNNSPMAIKGINGTMKVYDQFEERIVNINWDISDGIINAGETKKVTNYGVEYDQFDDSHKKLHRLKFEDLIFKYEAKQINFANGYKLKFDD